MVRPRPAGFERPTSGVRVSPSCRDKGRMWGRVGALCLSSSLFESLGFPKARWSHPNEDKHKAPTSTLPRPLSLQDAGRTFPDSVVKNHQALDHDGPVFCYLKALWIGDFKINQNIACHAL